MIIQNEALYNTDRFDFLQSDKSLLSSDRQGLFNLALLLCGYTKFKYSECDKYWGGKDDVNLYWGSNDDVNIMNFVCYICSELLNVDVTEDDEWVSYTNKATADEIAIFNVEMLLKKIPIFAPKYEKLFVVAVNVDRTGRGLVEALVDISERNFQVYSEVQIMQKKDLDCAVLESISKLKTFEMLSNSAYLDNILIRVA